MGHRGALSGLWGVTVVVLGGTTASGKSALALELAEKTGAVIVNADSVQTHRDLSILSARPDADALARAPHRLYGVLDAFAQPSLGWWLGAARAEIAALDGGPCLVVGGSGLYLEALEQGTAPTPPIDPAVRAEVRASFRNEGREAIARALEREDPAMAEALPARDPQRVMRALEVIRSTGRSALHWRALPRIGAVPIAAALHLDPPRAELRARIRARLEGMIEAGALDEIERLIAISANDRSLPIWRADGALALARVLDGELALDRALERAAIETGRYAKRQSAWFRHRASGWRRVAGFAEEVDGDAFDALARALRG